MLSLFKLLCPSDETLKGQGSQPPWLVKDSFCYSKKSRLTGICHGNSKNSVTQIIFIWLTTIKGLGYCQNGVKVKSNNQGRIITLPVGFFLYSHYPKTFA